MRHHVKVITYVVCAYEDGPGTVEETAYIVTGFCSAGETTRFRRPCIMYTNRAVYIIIYNLLCYTGQKYLS